MKMKKLSLLNAICDTKVMNCIGTPVPTWMNQLWQKSFKIKEEEEHPNEE